jgi:hypothetical protein
MYYTSFTIKKGRFFMAIEKVAGAHPIPKSITENIKKYAKQVNVDKGQEIIKKTVRQEGISKGIRKGFKVDTRA